MYPRACVCAQVSFDGTLRLWHHEVREAVFQLRTGQGATSVRFHPDDFRYLFTAGPGIYHPPPHPIFPPPNLPPPAQSSPLPRSLGQTSPLFGWMAGGVHLWDIRSHHTYVTMLHSSRDSNGTCCGAPHRASCIRVLPPSCVLIPYHHHHRHRHHHHYTLNGGQTWPWSGRTCGKISRPRPRPWRLLRRHSRNPTSRYSPMPYVSPSPPQACMPLSARPALMVFIFCPACRSSCVVCRVCHACRVVGRDAGRGEACVRPVQQAVGAALPGPPPALLGLLGGGDAGRPPPDHLGHRRHPQAVGRALRPRPGHYGRTQPRPRHPPCPRTIPPSSSSACGQSIIDWTRAHNQSIGGGLVGCSRAMTGGCCVARARGTCWCGASSAPTSHLSTPNATTTTSSNSRPQARRAATGSGGWRGGTPTPSPPSPFPTTVRVPPFSRSWGQPAAMVPAVVTAALRTHDVCDGGCVGAMRACDADTMVATADESGTIRITSAYR
jgi:hypothetical protein